jgi:hypothetical protein
MRCHVFFDLLSFCVKDSNEGKKINLGEEESLVQLKRASSLQFNPDGKKFLSTEKETLPTLP